MLRRLLFPSLSLLVLLSMTWCVECRSDDGFWSPTQWKLTLPENTNRPGNPDEVFPPELSRFSDSRFMNLDSQLPGIRLRAPCDGATTSGSKYPRTELRELQPDGKSLASWGTSDGKSHELHLTIAVTHLPQKKPHVIMAQIHGPEHKLLAIRIEKDKVLAEGEGQKDVVFRRNYELGNPLTLKIQTGDGKIRVMDSSQEVVCWDSSEADCYFKAGCYTQSNLKSGDTPESYGEVLITNLRIIHE